METSEILNEMLNIESRVQCCYKEIDVINRSRYYVDFGTQDEKEKDVNSVLKSIESLTVKFNKLKKNL